MNYQVINTNRIPFVYAYASLKFQDEFKRSTSSSTSSHEARNTSVSSRLTLSTA